MPIDPRIAMGFDAPNVNALAIQSQAQGVASNQFALQRAQQQQQQQNAMLAARQPAIQQYQQGNTQGAQMSALQSGDSDLLGMLNKLDENQHAKLKARTEAIGQAALGADTPEKWDSAIDFLSHQYPELAEYKGKFSPETRMAALAAAGEMKAYLDQSKPVNMAPGNRLVDPSSGRVISEAPFAPRTVTVSPGQTAVEFQPGGGDLSVEGLRPHFVAQESGGNYSAVNKDTGALGAYQVMPQTGQALAGQLGLPWRPDLMTSSTPEAKAYQDKIGGAAIQEAVSAGGGDPNKTFSYYYGGSDQSKWGPNTRKYAGEMMGRLGGGNSRVVAQGGSKPEWHTLTPDEAQAAGLPGGTYQRSPEGEIKPVAGTTGKNAAQPTGAAYSQSAMDAFDRAIDTANRLLNHPGLSTSVGAKGLTGGLLGGWTIPGTDAADFKAELNTMKAQVFLPMVQSMKGMGALSNAEGEKLTAAIGALDPNMTERGFGASLGRIIKDLRTYRDRATKQGGAPEKPSAGGWGKATVVGH